MEAESGRRRIQIAAPRSPSPFQSLKGNEPAHQDAQIERALQGRWPCFQSKLTRQQGIVSHRRRNRGRAPVPGNVSWRECAELQPCAPGQRVSRRSFCSLHLRDAPSRSVRLFPIERRLACSVSRWLSGQRLRIRGK